MICFSGKNWTASLLLLHLVAGAHLAQAALPIPPSGQIALRIEGSNTLGNTLAPEWAKALMQQEGYQDVRIETDAEENSHRIIGNAGAGQSVVIQVIAQGSAGGFRALQDGTAQLAAASRAIKAGELANLAAFGDLQSPGAEHVVALDGIAVILHPDNQLQALSIAQLGQVFSGQIDTWEQLGGSGGAIRLYALDANSGTFDTFAEKVLSPAGLTMADSAIRLASNARLADAVSASPQALGFVSLAQVGAAKTLAITDGEAAPLRPSAASVASEDYPLSRRLYLYAKPNEQNPWAQGLLELAISPAGQAIAAQNTFIAQRIEALQVTPNAQMPEAYQGLAREAHKLSVNFRFKEGSAGLDSKAQQDLLRLIDYLKQNDKWQNQVSLVGFGDAQEDPDRAALLSKLRAMAVRRELVKAGVSFRLITGLGGILPVAANSSESGRLKNRRVEVWVH